MNKTNVDQALAALADALKSSEPNSFVDNPKEFVKKIPFRSLSGDHINGGKIQNFSSTGITDKSTREQISVSDEGVIVSKFAKGFEVHDLVRIKTIHSLDAEIEHIKAGKIEAEQIIGEISYANDAPIVFNSEELEGKGILWSGKGYTKQLVFASNPDRIFLSENLDVGKGKYISINNLKIIDETSLGNTVIKSNLKEVGRLKGLIVDGSASIGEYFYFDASSNRLGLGTDQANAALSVVENNIEIVIGTKDTSKAHIGTFASHSFDIITDNQSRVHISADGNITLGNFKSSPVQVSVNGKLSVRVNNPDPDVDLHINGSIKFGGKLQMHGNKSPDGGSFNKGDICWNTEPFIGSYAGWICLQPGSPGLWEPFGKIGNQ